MDPALHQPLCDSPVQCARPFLPGPGLCKGLWSSGEMVRYRNRAPRGPGLLPTKTSEQPKDSRGLAQRTWEHWGGTSPGRSVMSPASPPKKGAALSTSPARSCAGCCSTAGHGQGCPLPQRRCTPAGQAESRDAEKQTNEVAADWDGCPAGDTQSGHTRGQHWPSTAGPLAVNHVDPHTERHGPSPTEDAAFQAPDQVWERPPT